MKILNIFSISIVAIILIIAAIHNPSKDSSVEYHITEEANYYGVYLDIPVSVRSDSLFELVIKDGDTVVYQYEGYEVSVYLLEVGKVSSNMLDVTISVNGRLIERKVVVENGYV